MITRTITNAGDPFVDGTGTPIVGAKISFTLVNAKGVITDGWDALTGERVAPGPVIVQTDADGVFTIDLWPTSRADQVLFWACSTDVENVADFVNSLTEGETLTWLAFRYTTVDPFELQSLLWLQVKPLLVSSGYEFIGAYADGPLNITRINQVFSHEGEYWRPLTSLALPYVTLENWATDVMNFVNIGDLMLRQDLGIVSGAGLVGYDGAETYPSDSVGAEVSQLRQDLDGGSDYIQFDDAETYSVGSIGAALAQAISDLTTLTDYVNSIIGFVRRFASGGDTIDLVGLSAVMATKTDDAATTVVVSDSSGKLIDDLTEYEIFSHNDTVFFIINEAGTAWISKS